MTDQVLRSGFVAIAGRPNMGKSTLLNRILGRKVAIVTPKAQTTRNRILGACHRPGCQMVFVDTPGIHQARGNPLNRAMVRTAMEACREVDLLLYMVEAAQGVTPADWEILPRLPVGDAPLFLLLNKMDRASPEKVMPRLVHLEEQARQHGVAFAEVVPLSATTGRNLERLLELVAARMPEGPPYFPEDQITDQSESFLAAEVVREKLFMLLREELPYALAVRTGEFQEEAGVLRVEGIIAVERESQKGIVIGRGGEMLKQVGTLARQEMERIFGLPVFLKLQVEVRHNWTGDTRQVSALGYGNQADAGGEEEGA